LLKVAIDDKSPGPLQLSAMLLEIASLCFLLNVLLTESDASYEQLVVEEDSCPIDAYDVLQDETELSKLSSVEVEKLKTCIDLEEKEEEKMMRRRQQQEQLLNGGVAINGETWMMLEDEDKEREEDDNDSSSGDYSAVNVSS